MPRIAGQRAAQHAKVLAIAVGGAARAVGQRHDAWPKDGSHPGSDLAFMREQLIDQFGMAHGILLPLLCAGDAFSLWNYWRKWDARNLKFLLPAVVLGIVIVIVSIDVGASVVHVAHGGGLGTRYAVFRQG